MNTEASAQDDQKSAEAKRDTTHIHAISIADLELIDPENRLIPESKEEETQAWSFEGYVESPLSSSKEPQKPNPTSKVTTKDLRALETMSTPKRKQQAISSPSR